MGAHRSGFRLGQMLHTIFDKQLTTIVYAGPQRLPQTCSVCKGSHRYSRSHCKRHRNKNTGVLDYQLVFSEDIDGNEDFSSQLTDAFDELGQDEVEEGAGGQVT
jgi:hypothetical protein